MGKGKTRQTAHAAGHPALPGNLQFILDQGISLLQQGQPAPAETYFRQVLTAVPQHLDALQFLGVIEYQKGRFAAAAELLQRAIDPTPRVCTASWAWRSRNSATLNRRLPATTGPWP